MVDLFEKLSEEDRIKTYKYISCYAGKDADSINPAANLEYLLRFWNKNKQDLYKLLGNEVIISREVNFVASPDELEDEYIDRISGWDAPGRAFRDWYLACIVRMSMNNEISYREESILNFLIEVEDLCANTYTGTDTIVIRNGNKNFALVPNMKLGKFFNKFNKLMGGDQDTFEKFRIAHSMLLNQKTMKGTLCLSIHPLDYMTMSDNDSDWESCMSWQGAGDYRQGTIEMMNSPCVIMAYLKSKDDMKLWYNNKDNDGLWNNKRWRELFIVRPEILLAIKGYPYQNDNLSAIVLNWLKELAGKNLGWDSYTQYLNKIKNRQINTIGEIGKDVDININANYMYNDIYSEHDAYIATNIPCEKVFKIDFNYSGETECMNCGEAIEYGCLNEANFLECNSCSGTIQCECCGEWFEAENLYDVNGENYCISCYENYTGTCSNCENVYNENDLEDIMLSDGINDPTYECVSFCNCCIADKNVIKKYFTHPFHEWKKNVWCSYNYTDFDELTPAGRKLFDISDERYEEMAKNKVEMIRRRFAS